MLRSVPSRVAKQSRDPSSVVKSLETSAKKADAFELSEGRRRSRAQTFKKLFAGKGRASRVVHVVTPLPRQDWERERGRSNARAAVESCKSHDAGFDLHDHGAGEIDDPAKAEVRAIKLGRECCGGENSATDDREGGAI